jgi:hypothetical protein
MVIVRNAHYFSDRLLITLIKNVSARIEIF